MFFTNKPTLVKNVSAIPGISDHEIVLADCNIKPTINKRAPRFIHQWRKADWEKLKSETITFGENFIAGAASRSVSENYQLFKQYIQDTINKYVPKRLLKIGKNNLPWITPNIRRLCRKKQRLFNKAKRSHRSKDWQEYKKHKKHTLQSIRRAHWNYVNSILQDGLESNDSKPFWRYVKSNQQDSVGVSPLKSVGKLYAEAKDKADILNKQFQSVFTPPQSPDAEIPTLAGPKTPLISPLVIQVKGVEKLLAGLNVKKASGPDNIPCKILRELSAELAPILTTIYQQSMETGQIPDDWATAFVSPIFKKGNRNLPENYRPVSLTSVPSKILEHIICSHVRDHLDKHNVLTPLQHGFRGAHSCETQLLTTLQDLLYWRDRRVQVDVAVLDFTKAFDTVPHRSLLRKLEHYGLDTQLIGWVNSFLIGRSQCVVVDGERSEFVSVDSGVPQGTVLGPLLFLLHINDLPQSVCSSVRLFANDCLLYKTITSMEDTLVLQRDLDSLKEWGSRWGMRFNVSKCNIMRLAWSRQPMTKFYTLGGEIIEEVNQAKYLGVTLTSELNWSTHIDITTNKANSTLGFLRRNLRCSPKSLKELSYMSLVRSKLEYCSSIWDPHFTKDTDKLERVNRRTARFVSNDYRWRSSVTSMLQDLGWQDLAGRRRNIRLALFYKIVHHLVAVPTDDLLIKADSRLRAHHKHKFQTIRTNSDAYKFSFFPRTLIEWNTLPKDTAEAPSLDCFKQRLCPAALQVPRAASSELALGCH